MTSAQQHENLETKHNSHTWPFWLEPASGTAPAVRNAAASANLFVLEEQASASALQAGGLPTGGVGAGGSLVVGGTVGEEDQTALLVGLLQQSLQQNQQIMQQN